MAKNSKSLNEWKDDLQMQGRGEIARGNSQNLLKTVVANFYLFKRYSRGGMWECFYMVSLSFMM